MKASTVKKALVLIAANILTVACGSGITPAPVIETGSVTMDFPGISSDLRKNEKLIYDLSCAEDKTKIRAAKPVSAKDDSPNPAIVTLKFQAKDVKPGYWCALEVNAQDPAKLGKSDYRWLSKQQKVGLFYASEPAQVSQTRRLNIVMRALYEHPEQLDLAVKINADLGSLKISDVKKSDLICGSVAYPAKVEGESGFSVRLEKKDFSTGQKCRLRVNVDSEDFDSDEITVKSSETSYKAVFSLDPAQVRVVTTEGQKCAYDVETMECVK